MSLKLLAIDLGKRSFHCHGIDSDGVISSRKVSRSKLIETIKELAPETVAMEACASAHFWGRSFLGNGHQVLLINPRFVKPFVKGSKNDAADAEGIYEAALRPTMRFVPVKSTEQQDLQSLHRARERVVCARTALINHMRGLLGEYGVILPQGAWRFLTQAADAIATAEFLIWLWCEASMRPAERPMGASADHAASTAFQISGARPSLIRSVPSLN
jgi:transposase